MCIRDRDEEESHAHVDDQEKGGQAGEEPQEDEDVTSEFRAYAQQQGQEVADSQRVLESRPVSADEHSQLCLLYTAVREPGGSVFWRRNGPVQRGCVPGAGQSRRLP